MALDTSTESFHITFSGNCFNYWLLDPPSDHSPLVATYYRAFGLAASDSVLLANTSELTDIVDEAICATKDYQQAQQLEVGSQCNRFMKHVQVSAIYFSHCEVISSAVVKHLHLAMRHLYECQPPHEASGKEILSSIANVTSAIVETVQTRLYHLKKSQGVMDEVLERIESSTTTNASEGITPIHKLIHIATESAAFWQVLYEVFKTLEQITNEIRDITVKKVILSAAEFEQYKRNVIQISCRWIAIRQVCTLLIKEISPQLREVVKGALPNNLTNIDEFNEFACVVNVHFDDLDSVLMTTDFNIMQSKISIYSKWIKPTMNVSFPKCLETVEQVNQLVKLGRVQEVPRKIMEVTQQSRRVKTITEVYIQRLEELEKYAVFQQEKLMRRMGQLEDDRKKKRQQIEAMEATLAGKQEEVSELGLSHYIAEQNKSEAEQKKKEAEERLDEAKTWWWVPIYGPYLNIREAIEDNSTKIEEEERHISKYKSKSDDLLSVIDSVRNEISKLKRDVSRLTEQIDELKDELTKRIGMLKEMKEATATLKNSVYNWMEFTSTIDHGTGRSDAMQKLVTQAESRKDAARVLQSGSTQTAMKSFTEAFQSAERILSTQWQCMVSYDYMCVLCGCKKSGLPLPVNEETVVCNECAHKHIE